MVGLGKAPAINTATMSEAPTMNDATNQLCFRSFILMEITVVVPPDTTVACVDYRTTPSRWGCAGWRFSTAVVTARHTATPTRALQIHHGCNQLLLGEAHDAFCASH